MKYFEKVLIANRGEIAIRVMRACRELNIETVAIYSNADKDALHVKYADEAFLVGEAPPSKSYLNIERIVDIAKKSGSEAIHPGYGFLAENYHFAERCTDEGITFIGPSWRTIRAMGSKIESKQMMREAGVPVVPGTPGGVKEPDEARKIAEEIGYPVIVKASAGGGGIFSSNTVALNVCASRVDVLRFTIVDYPYPTTTGRSSVSLRRLLVGEGAG